MDNNKECMASRQKYFSELTDSEKIERTRDVVRTMRFEINELRSSIEILKRHKHLDDKLVQEIFGGFLNGTIDSSRRAEDKDKTYF